MPECLKMDVFPGAWQYGLNIMTHVPLDRDLDAFG